VTSIDGRPHNPYGEHSLAYVSEIGQHKGNVRKLALTMREG